MLTRLPRGRSMIVAGCSAALLATALASVTASANTGAGSASGSLPNRPHRHREACAATCRSTRMRRHGGGRRRQPAQTPRPQSVAVPHRSTADAALAPKIPSPGSPTAPKHTVKSTLKSARHLTTKGCPRRIDTLNKGSKAPRRPHGMLKSHPALSHRAIFV